MIGISTLTQNMSGDLIIHEKISSDIDNFPARVSRTKTLDGGVHIEHSGLSHGDRTFSVVAELSEADKNKLVSIHTTEKLLNVSTRDGFYLAAISSVRRHGADTLIIILIKEKV